MSTGVSSDSRGATARNALVAIGVGIASLITLACLFACIRRRRSSRQPIRLPISAPRPTLKTLELIAARGDPSLETINIVALSTLDSSELGVNEIERRPISTHQRSITIESTESKTTSSDRPATSGTTGSKRHSLFSPRSRPSTGKSSTRPASGRSTIFAETMPPTPLSARFYVVPRVEFRPATGDETRQEGLFERQMMADVWDSLADVERGDDLVKPRQRPQSIPEDMTEDLCDGIDREYRKQAINLLDFGEDISDIRW